MQPTEKTRGYEQNTPGAGPPYPQEAPPSYHNAQVTYHYQGQPSAYPSQPYPGQPYPQQVSVVTVQPGSVTSSAQLIPQGQPPPAGLALGLSICCCIACPFLNLFSLICGIPALVLSAFGFNDTTNGRYRDARWKVFSAFALQGVMILLAVISVIIVLTLMCRWDSLREYRRILKPHGC